MIIVYFYLNMHTTCNNTPPAEPTKKRDINLMRKTTVILTLVVAILRQGFSISPVNLKTSSGLIPGINGVDLLNYVATPTNWPQFVLSSSHVKGVCIDQPLEKGSRVTEFFGLPSILPLRVEWICATNTFPFLDVISPDGVPGLASDCRMQFRVREATEGVELDLTMSFIPLSPLARLAVPLLILDNTIAVKGLLPLTLQQKNHQLSSTKAPINEFRTLMGSLYGVAGVLHLFDLVLGGSNLFTSAGIPPFQNLPFAGQMLALVWCAVGPVSFALSRTVQLADAGLILYGMVEVGGAGISAAFFPLADFENIFLKAIVVQLVVFAAYLYSAAKTPGTSN